MHNFSILSQVGEGAYSSVLKVRRISDSKFYALKKVKLPGLKDKQKSNALNQVRLLASLKHPSIIAYRDAFLDQSSSSLCIVMDFAEGGDLAKRIQSAKAHKLRFQEQEVWRMLEDILPALAYIHSKNIVHRDIKSANIFSTGGGFKLADLNVSKLLKLGLAYTQTGTPYYASPQVWRDQPYDSRSDVWSLGVVVYQMCTLSPPFKALSMEDLFKKVTKGNYEKLPSSYSSRLQSFVKDCLVVNKNQRPSSQQLLQKYMPNQLNEYQKQPNLIGTIHMPKQLQGLKDRLPKSRYEERQKMAVVTKAESQRASHLPSIPPNKRQPVKEFQKQDLLAQLKAPVRSLASHAEGLPANNYSQVEEKRLAVGRPPEYRVKRQNLIEKARQEVARAKAFNYKRPDWWG